MSVINLRDFGGRFLTTGSVRIDDKTYPGVSAYVQYFIPVDARETSITFVHGGGGQGAEFLSTSDGRPGWAHVFLKAGFPVYILDRPGHGRNVWNEAVLGQALPPPDYESLYPRFVETAAANLWPEASKHSRWPEYKKAADRFMASQGVMATTLEASQRHVEAIADELFEITGHTAIISHSAGGPCGWALAAMGGNSVAAVIAVEPLGYPGMTHPLGTFGDGLLAAAAAGSFDPYARPCVIVTGEAGWMRDANNRAAAFLESRGHSEPHLRLEEYGLTGNGHMMMSETNSDSIAKLLVDWIEQQL